MSDQKNRKGTMYVSATTGARAEVGGYITRGIPDSPDRNWSARMDTWAIFTGEEMKSQGEAV